MQFLASYLVKILEPKKYKSKSSKVLNPKSFLKY